MQGEQEGPEAIEDPWERALAEDPHIAASHDPEHFFLYRPGRIVVDEARLPQDERADRFFSRLAEAGFERIPPKDVRIGTERRRLDPPERPTPDLAHNAAIAEHLGFAMYHDPAGRAEGLPELVRELRREVEEAAVLEHVLVADPHKMGGTGPAIPAPHPADIPGRDASAGKGIKIAILDTGLDPTAGLGPVDQADAEIPDADGDHVLDPPAGHGTFIAGIIKRLVPGAELIVERILTGPAGTATDLDVAEAILRLPDDVDLVNCSFGGPSLDDGPPIVIARALSHLSPSTVVVCAAGNQAEDRPHWPAAFKGVVGVGSVLNEAEQWARTDYTNFGWWVNACAPGSDVHSTFLEFREQGGAGREFHRGALWSGTSFAAPQVVAALAETASREGISVKKAVWNLIDDPGLTRMLDLGTLVVP